MQLNHMRLTRRELGIVCAAHMVGTTAMNSSAFAGDLGDRDHSRIGKLTLTQSDSVSKHQTAIPSGFLAAALTILKAGKRSPETSKLQIRLNIEHAKGVCICDQTLSFRNGGLSAAPTWARSDEGVVILVDYPRLRDFLRRRESYIFTITTIVPISSKGVGDQFLSMYWVSK